jgi:hypothetical protein
MHQSEYLMRRRARRPPAASRYGPQSASALTDQLTAVPVSSSAALTVTPPITIAPQATNLPDLDEDSRMVTSLRTLPPLKWREAWAALPRRTDKGHMCYTLRPGCRMRHRGKHCAKGDPGDGGPDDSHSVVCRPTENGGFGSGTAFQTT